MFTKTSVRSIKLLWTLQLDNQPRQMHNLFPPLLVSNVQTSGGPREMAVVAGVSDNIYGIDVEKGTQVWKRHFDSTFQEQPGGRGGGPLCPGGLTATPTIAPTEAPGKFKVYAISWDGRLRQLDVATGEDLAPAEPFLPANGKPYGLNLYKNVIYTTTAQGCGGNPNQFYGYDLETKKVGAFNPGSGGLWPRLGPSIGKDGTVYAGSGDGDYLPEEQIYGQAIVAVKQNPTTKALEMTDWFAPSNAVWLRKRDLDMNTTGPVFDFKGREYTVQSSKECRIWLLDTSALGGEDHRTPVYRTPLVCNEEVNSNPPASGVRSRPGRIPTAFGGSSCRSGGRSTRSSRLPSSTVRSSHGGVAAFKVEEKLGKVQLTPAWLSRDMYHADRRSSPTAWCSDTATERTPRRRHRRSALRSIAPRTASRVQVTRPCTRSTVGPETSSGRAAIRSSRSITSRACRWRMAAFTSARMTASCIASASTATLQPRDRSRMTHHLRAISILSGIVGLSAALLHAQGRGGGEWTTSGYDAQRSAWLRSDARLTKDAVRKGEFKFLWKVSFKNDTRQLNSLTEPILLDRLIGYRGFKALAFIGGSADRVFAIDTDLARPYWTTNLNYSALTGGQAPESSECPGGLIATPSRRTSLVQSAFAGGGGGRGGAAAGSSVGEPGRGAAILSQMAARGAAPAGAGGGRAAQPPPAGRGPAPIAFGGVDPLFAVGSDGLVHTLLVSNGADGEPAVPFLPPHSKPSALIWIDGTIYASTSDNCGAVPNGVWALDMTAKEKKPVSWKTGDVSIAGSTGPAFSSTGTLFVALHRPSSQPNSERSQPGSTSAVVALDPTTLQPKDWSQHRRPTSTCRPSSSRSKGKIWLQSAGTMAGSTSSTRARSEDPITRSRSRCPRSTRGRTPGGP